MRKLEKLQIIKNVSSSWFALAANVVVGFFLWPIIVHRLGDDAAGIWVLIFSITGYYGLFDLGIRIFRNPVRFEGQSHQRRGGREPGHQYQPVQLFLHRGADLSDHAAWSHNL